MTLTKIFSFLIFLSFLSPIFAADEGFPGRKKYPDTPYIELGDFHKGYRKGQFTVVDARSSFEYDVIKIKDAVNVPISSETFESDVKALAQKTGKTLVFYCNGRRCMKSFKAAIKSKLKNVLVFDSGVFEWSVAYPEDSVLLTESPMDPKKIISSQNLKEHFLPLTKFEEKIKGSVLLDVRDKHQRKGSGLFLLADKSVPLDNRKKLERYLTKAIAEKKTLLAYDQAGKQVRWLQYYLEDRGVKDYYFMKGGAKYYKYDEQKEIASN